MTSSSFLALRGSIFKYCGCAFKSYVYFFSRKNHYDIAIAGGGLVGTAMACAVVKCPKLSDKKIVLFESSPPKTTPKKSVDDGYSNRVVSLNPGTRKFFESIGAWTYINDVRYKTVKKMQVWDACSDVQITFNDDLINDVSYIVENDLILYSLEQIVNDNKSNIEVKYQSKIKCFQLPQKNEPVNLEMENGDKYTCSLLIGADGANSQTRKALKCQYLCWDYHQKAIVATLQLSEASGNCEAWQRFLPSGPVALLPLTQDLSSLVWSTGTKEADELLQLSDESFVDAVNDAFWKTYPRHDFVSSATNYLNKILESLTLNSNAVRQLPPSVSAVLPKSRAAFPLSFGHSTKYVAPGVALIGDAAHRVHPLAGQGVNLGFGDVECLTKKLAESVFNGNKLGSPAALASYESERQTQIVPMLATIDLLHKLYSTSFTPVVLLRSLGLQVTNVLTPVKLPSDISNHFWMTGGFPLDDNG